MNESGKTVSILGCGWLGLPLGEHLVTSGYHVRGSTTSEEKVPIISAKGIHPYLFSIDDEINGDVQDFFNCDILILNIPPKRREPGSLDKYSGKIKAIIQYCRSGSVDKIIFTSSTSVYMNTNQLVNENSALDRSRHSSHILIQAEKMIVDSGMKYTILRLAGLIGNERRPTRWFAGKSSITNGQGRVNMVHLEDCISAISKVMTEDRVDSIYNLCADNHPTRRDFYTAQFLKEGKSIPSFDSEEGSYKIVDNSKFKEDYNFQYLYPDPIKF